MISTIFCSIIIPSGLALRTPEALAIYACWHLSGLKTIVLLSVWPHCHRIQFLIKYFWALNIERHQTLFLSKFAFDQRNLRNLPYSVWVGHETILRFVYIVPTIWEYNNEFQGWDDMLWHLQILKYTRLLSLVPNKIIFICFFLLIYQ